MGKVVQTHRGSDCIISFNYTVNQSLILLWLNEAATDFNCRKFVVDRADKMIMDV